MRHRVLRHSLGRWVDPAVAYAAVCGAAEHAFWLDSGVHASAGMSYLGTAARVVTTTDFDGSIFDFLRTELGQTSAETDLEHPGFALGWVGWLGYELRGETMAAPVIHSSRYPDAAFLFVDRALAFDHASREVWLLALADDFGSDSDSDSGSGWDGELGEWRAETIAQLAASVAVPVPAVRSRAVATWRYSDDEYLAMIESCQAAIADGDAYQLCLTTEASVNVSPDPFTTYLALRESSPTHHGALIRVGGVSLLSSSPEQFLSVSPGGVVETKPIKGTRPRAVLPADDAALRSELVNSEKERAENLMIVDLMRNDIGRISLVGTVSVPSLLAVESYAQVHQLVSTVRGQLAQGVTGLDAVISCFPAGSMTGAPKRSATAILDRLEKRASGIYSGVFGYFGLDGSIDLAMVIRSIVIDPAGSTVGTGGGITALSVPTEELEETRVKAAALLAVLGADVR